MNVVGGMRRYPHRIYGGQEGDVRVAERRERLITTGIRLFGTRGFHATTVRTLIAESELATRYFYESFDSRESLLITCYDQVTQALRCKLESILHDSHLNMESAARAGLRCCFERMRDKHFARITQIEILGVSAAVDDRYFKATREYAALIITTLKRFDALQNAADDDLEILGITMAGAIATAGAHWVRGGYANPIEQVIETTLMVLKGTASQVSGRSALHA